VSAILQTYMLPYQDHHRGIIFMVYAKQTAQKLF